MYIISILDIYAYVREKEKEWILPTQFSSSSYTFLSLPAVCSLYVRYTDVFSFMDWLKMLQANIKAFPRRKDISSEVSVVHIIHIQ